MRYKPSRLEPKTWISPDIFRRKQMRSMVFGSGEKIFHSERKAEASLDVNSPELVDLASMERKRMFDVDGDGMLAWPAILDARITEVIE